MTQHRDELSTALDSEFPEDVRHVELDRLRFNEQKSRDLSVHEATTHVCRNLCLPPRERLNDRWEIDSGAIDSVFCIGHESMIGYVAFTSMFTNDAEFLIGF
jgi:hypothetical protein